MNPIIRGRAFVFGANIDTDQICPGRFLELTDPNEIAKHLLEGPDPNLVSEFRPGDMIVASTNFGCGSSREQAAIGLKALGVGAILAASFARIFYRNAINLGIPLLVCPQMIGCVRRGDLLRVDLSTGEVINEVTGAMTQAQPLSEYVLRILENGGIKPLIRSEIGADEGYVIEKGR